MKKIALLFIFLPLLLSAQQVEGEWFGSVKIAGRDFRLQFNIAKSGDSLRAEMISLDQGARATEADVVEYEGDSLMIGINKINLRYSGIFGGDSIKGTFSQGFLKVAMNLYREQRSAQTQRRPQEPQEPYPYISEMVTFRNGDVTLAGTLTQPRGGEARAAAVLVTGSGAQNRDEEIMGHRPFLVAADYLTRNGIAVLRYDDRGTAQSTGDFARATTLDFAEDARAAVKFLSNRGFEKIGVIGHSEGGTIAPIVAVEEPELDYIVLLAGTGVRGDSIVLMQSDLIAAAMGANVIQRGMNRAVNRTIYNKVLAGESREQIAQYLQKTAMMPADRAEQTAAQMTTSWYRTFLQYDPEPVLEKVTCRVLALNGEKDLQVPCKENLEAIERALVKGGNRDYKIVALPGLNHLFQQCDKGLPQEYGTIEQTIAPEVLEIIRDFILFPTIL